MIFSSCGRKAISFAAAALAIGASIPAHAADRFGVVGVENKTHVVIRFQHHWGDGKWQHDVLAPGVRKHFWWTYPKQNADKSPPFHVKFDSDLSKGKFVEKYDLKKNACPDHTWECAHKHVFKYDGGKNFIDLYTE